MTTSLQLPLSALHPLEEADSPCPSPTSSFDSLFDEPVQDSESSPPLPVARTTCPPIEGLYIFPSLLSLGEAIATLEALSKEGVFAGGTRDQVMLFSPPPSVSTSNHRLPPYVTDLLIHLETKLTALLPPHIFELVFKQDLARQVILNLYPVGEGITSHVDLPTRYADGILGVSIVGGCAMTFTRVKGDHAPHGTIHDNQGKEGGDRWDVYLPAGTVYILSGEARWAWEHGIQGRAEDLVVLAESESENGSVSGKRTRTVLRGTRVSMTYRWMADGGDVLS